jgi:RHS repeat-associated protein
LQVLATSAETYFYDAAGRMLQKITPEKIFYYEYDVRGLLTRFHDGQNETIYEYDALGNRIAKTVNGERTAYLVNIAQPIPQVLAEMDGEGQTTQTYAFGLGRLSSTGTDPNGGSGTGSVPGGESRYFLQDALGSSIGLTDISGAVVETYSYNAFGGSLNADQFALTNFQYAGEQFDAETGLIYLRARYYDSSLGRFISRDPVYLGNQSETQSYNPFIYVQNDPVNLVDPTGEVPFVAWLLVAVGPVIFDLYSYRATEAYFNKKTGQDLWAVDVYSETALWGLVTMFLPTPFGKGLEGIAYHSTKNYSQYAVLSNTLKLYSDEAFGETLQFGFNTVQSQINSSFQNSNTNQQGGGNQTQTNPGMAGDDNNQSTGGTLPPGGGNSSGTGGNFFGDLFGGIGDFFGSLFGSIGNFVSGIGSAASSLFSGIANLFRGGVYMDKALEVIGENIKDIQGVSYDPLTGQIIMLSDVAAGVPEIPVDYFLAALKAVLGSDEVPGVTITPAVDESGNPDWTQDQTIRPSHFRSRSFNETNWCRRY